jgi:hypothetical protein
VFAELLHRAIRPRRGELAAMLFAAHDAHETPNKVILRIAEELGLFEHLESEEVRGRLFLTYPAFRIAGWRRSASFALARPKAGVLPRRERELPVHIS